MPTTALNDANVVRHQATAEFSVTLYVTGTAALSIAVPVLAASFYGGSVELVRA